MHDKTNWPQWLKEARISDDAKIEIDDYGRVIWHSGTWKDGTWLNGTWKDRRTKNRLAYMLSLAGVVVCDGVAIGFRTTKSNGDGRYTRGFTQKEGEYFEDNLPPSGSGTCVAGIHITPAARAWTYFGIDPDCQFWRVTCDLKDVLDCDGEKARIRGGFFERIDNPFV